MVGVLRALVGAAVVWATTGCARSPSIFRPAGRAADEIARLGWLFTIIAAAVTVIVTGVLVAALYRRRPERTGSVEPVGDPRGPVRWIIVGGVVLPAIILLVCFVFTLRTQAAIARPPRPAVVTVLVTAHRWWWEVRYMGLGPDETVVTANEIHVPAGRPVRINLVSNDVIHSFWVPELAGKTDVIPGQDNSMWLQASRPGPIAVNAPSIAGCSTPTWASRWWRMRPPSSRRGCRGSVRRRCRRPIP